MCESEVPAQLLGLQEFDIVSCIQDPEGAATQKAVAIVTRLIDALSQLHTHDTAKATHAIDAALAMSSDTGSSSFAALSFALSQRFVQNDRPPSSPPWPCGIGRHHLHSVLSGVIICTMLNLGPMKFSSHTFYQDPLN